MTSQCRMIHLAPRTSLSLKPTAVTTYTSTKATQLAGRPPPSDFNVLVGALHRVRFTRESRASCLRSISSHAWWKDELSIHWISKLIDSQSRAVSSMASTKKYAHMHHSGVHKNTTGYCYGERYRVIPQRRDTLWDLHYLKLKRHNELANFR